MYTRYRKIITQKVNFVLDLTNVLPLALRTNRIIPSNLVAYFSTLLKIRVLYVISMYVSEMFRENVSPTLVKRNGGENIISLKNFLQTLVIFFIFIVPTGL